MVSTVSFTQAVPSQDHMGKKPITGAFAGGCDKWTKLARLRDVEPPQHRPLGASTEVAASTPRIPPVTRVFRFLAALLLVGLVAGPARAESLTTDAGHVVRWDDGLAPLGRRVHALLPQVRKQVEAKIGFPFPGGPAEVVVVSGLARMRAETGAGVPDWAAGVCVGSKSLIVLRSDRLKDSGLVRAWPSTLRHEWVHLAWSRRAGQYTRRLPLWAEEGLAEEIGGGISVGGGAKLDFAAKWTGLIPMDEIRTHWPGDSSDAALAYRQGRSWIRYFVKQRSWDELRTILRELADGQGASESPGAGRPFDELLYKHTDSTLSKWTAEWKIHLEETADPLFYLLLRDLTGTIFFVIAVIGAIAFFFIRRRRRKQIAELPDDPFPPGAAQEGEGA